jgi:hypothetical protein
MVVIARNRYAYGCIVSQYRHHMLLLRIRQHIVGEDPLTVSSRKRHQRQTGLTSKPAASRVRTRLIASRAKPRQRHRSAYAHIGYGNDPPPNTLGERWLQTDGRDLNDLSWLVSWNRLWKRKLRRTTSVASKKLLLNLYRDLVQPLLRLVRPFMVIADF